MTGLEVGKNLGKAGKVLGISPEPGHGTSSWNGGKRVPLGEAKSSEGKKGEREGFAEDQVVATLHIFPAGGGYPIIFFVLCLILYLFEYYILT